MMSQGTLLSTKREDDEEEDEKHLFFFIKLTFHRKHAIINIRDALFISPHNHLINCNLLLDYS